MHVAEWSVVCPSAAGIVRQIDLWVAGHKMNAKYHCGLVIQEGEGYYWDAVIVFLWPSQSGKKSKLVKRGSGLGPLT